MNYRHIYHAGNFADVFKHAVIARIVTYLKGKEKAFRVIDTHAGIGIYDLASEEAQKTAEWQNGIGKLFGAPLSDDTAQGLLAPYLAAVTAQNAQDGITRYPGSPALVRHLMRKQDRLSAVELHPDDVETLRRQFAGDHQVKVIALDGWLALGAHLPPKERRGLVVVDPPFEKTDEFSRMADGLVEGHRRWPTGIYCLWYPLKAGADTARFHRALEETGIRRIFVSEFWVRDRKTPTGLNGSGLILVNPPFTLEDELTRLMPALVERLAVDRSAGHASFWLAGE